MARKRDLAKLDRAIRAIKARSRRAPNIDAAEVFRWARLPDDDPERAVVAQGVTFSDDHLNINIDDFIGGDPPDYLKRIAPEFFHAIGSKRSEEILNGACMNGAEFADFRAVYAWHAFGEYGTSVCVYEISGSSDESIFGTVYVSGGGPDYEERVGPLF